MSSSLANYCLPHKQHFAASLAETCCMAEKSINEVLAGNLAHFMKLRGIESQSDLARRSGVAQRTISNYLNPDLREQGISGKQPSAKLTEVDKIAKSMNVEAWDLLRDLTDAEREMYERIEAAYKHLMASPSPPGDARNQGDRRRNQLIDSIWHGIERRKI